MAYQYGGQVGALLAARYALGYFGCNLLRDLLRYGVSVYDINYLLITNLLFTIYVQFYDLIICWFAMAELSNRPIAK